MDRIFAEEKTGTTLSHTWSSDAHVSSGVVEYPLEFLSTCNALKVETVGGPIPVGQRRTVDRVDVRLHQ